GRKGRDGWVRTGRHGRRLWLGTESEIPTKTLWGWELAPGAGMADIRTGPRGRRSSQSTECDFRAKTLGSSARGHALRTGVRARGTGVARGSDRAARLAFGRSAATDGRCPSGRDEHDE